MFYLESRSVHREPHTASESQWCCLSSGGVWGGACGHTGVKFEAGAGGGEKVNIYEWVSTVLFYFSYFDIFLLVSKAPRFCIYKRLKAKPYYRKLDSFAFA